MVTLPCLQVMFLNYGNKEEVSWRDIELGVRDTASDEKSRAAQQRRRQRAAKRKRVCVSYGTDKGTPRSASSEHEPKATVCDNAVCVALCVGRGCILQAASSVMRAFTATTAPPVAPMLTTLAMARVLVLVVRAVVATGAPPQAPTLAQHRRHLWHASPRNSTWPRVVKRGC